MDSKLSISESSPLLSQTKSSDDVPHSSSVCHGEYTLLLAALCGSFVISYSPVSIIISFLPVYIEDRFGITANGNSILFSIWPLTYALCAPFVPSLIFRIGREKTLMMGFVISIVSTIWFGVLSIWVELYLARALQGVGSSLISVACQSILTDVFRANIGPAMGFRESFIGATFAGAPLVGGFLYELLGYEMLFISHACVMLLWALIMVYVLAKRRHLIQSSTSGEQNPNVGFTFLCQFDILVAAAVVLMAYFPFGALQPNLEVHFQQVLQLDPAGVGAFYFIQASIAIVAGPFIGALNKRTDARKLLLWGFSLQVIMFFIFGPPAQANALFDSYSVMMVTQISCMLILGLGAVLILTSSYCLLSFVILSKPNGSAEVASSVFLFLEGAATTSAPLITSFVMSLSPESTSANCIAPCEQGNQTETDCDAACLSSFPTTSLIFSLSYFLFTLFLYFVFPRIQYDFQDALKQNDHQL